MPDPTDIEAVTRQLGRKPQSKFEVVVRDKHGEPAVIRNAPFLDDGTPMPTLYWLTSPDLIREIGHVESAGGVQRADVEVDPEVLKRAHESYAAQRDALIPDGYEGPRPSGGVGGTRKGVKCLHAHYAYLLAGGDDPVGRWVEEHFAFGPSGQREEPVAEGTTKESIGAQAIERRSGRK